MMRIIALILMLAVCFLLGVLYGTERGETQFTSEYPHGQPDEIEQVENRVGRDQSELPQEQLEEALLETEDAPIYKAASALEAVVDFFYEVVVEILYQLSKLFV